MIFVANIHGVWQMVSRELLAIAETNWFTAGDEETAVRLARLMNEDAEATREPVPPDMMPIVLVGGPSHGKQLIVERRMEHLRVPRPILTRVDRRTFQFNETELITSSDYDYVPNHGRDPKRLFVVHEQFETIRKALSWRIDVDELPELPPDWGYSFLPISILDQMDSRYGKPTSRRFQIVARRWTDWCKQSQYEDRA